MPFQSLAWWIVFFFLAAGAIILFLETLGNTHRRNMSEAHFTKLCFSGLASALTQAILLCLTNIPTDGSSLALTMLAVTVLGLLAGLIVLKRLRWGRLSSETATYLLFTGHIVYPAFLVVFMLWSWEIS